MRAGDQVCVRESYGGINRTRLVGRYGIVLKDDREVVSYPVEVLFDGGKWSWTFRHDELDLVIE